MSPLDAALAAAAAALLATAGVAAAPEHLSWYGDPTAPDISGVWVRATPAAPGPSKEGWLPWPPPLKGDFAATYARRTADPAARTDDPVRACLPPGMPRFTTGATGAMLIVQTPGRVTISRAGLPVRRIWVDGRPLPAAKDIESFFNGNSVGRYDHGALVTEVAGLRDQPLDATGVPHSDDLRLTERYRRVDKTTLVVDVTATDPTAFTAPLATHVTFTAVTDPRWEPHEILCTPGTDTHPDNYVH